VVAFDSLGTLFDLGELEDVMQRVLHRAVSLTVSGEWASFRDVARSVDPDLPKRLAELDAYPDARNALELLQSTSRQVWVLTNGGAAATEELLERNGLRDQVAEVHTVAEVKRYKPHPAAYRLLPRGAALIAAHDWDVAGARSAGYRAIWLARRDWALPLPQPGRGDLAENLLEAANLATPP
jgi:2-haloacid dehalogenase